MEEVVREKIDREGSRRFLQWLLAPVVVVTIAFGWKYPLLGFTVPFAMVTGMVGGMVRGRYVCGNLCPRGGFFDRIMAPLSPRRPIPSILRSMTLRWIVFALLMGFMAWRISLNPADIDHWGRVFWSMCAITTGVGVVLALTIHPRSWCAFCPIGTFQKVSGGEKLPLRIDPSCRECGLCEKSCTFNLPIVRHRESGVHRESDCLHCAACVEACPKGALGWSVDRDRID